MFRCRVPWCRSEVMSARPFHTINKGLRRRAASLEILLKDPDSVYAWPPLFVFFNQTLPAARRSYSSWQSKGSAAVWAGWRQAASVQPRPR